MHSKFMFTHTVHVHSIGGDTQHWDEGVNRERTRFISGPRFLQIPSETLLSRLLPQHWAWGQLHFLTITWFPGLAGLRGGARSRVNAAPSPRLTRREQIDKQI
jgi:hypothetical protein